MFEQVQAAKRRLKGHANETPVMTSRTLNQMVGADVYFKTLNRMVGADVYFKCETFQRGGAFKFRGAFNSICQLTDTEKKCVN